VQRFTTRWDRWSHAEHHGGCAIIAIERHFQDFEDVLTCVESKKNSLGFVVSSGMRLSQADMPY